MCLIYVHLWYTCVGIHVSDIRAPLALQVYMCLIYVYYLDGQTCQICRQATRGRLVRQHIRRDRSRQRPSRYICIHAPMDIFMHPRGPPGPRQNPSQEPARAGASRRHPGALHPRGVGTRPGLPPNLVGPVAPARPRPSARVLARDKTRHKSQPKRASPRPRPRPRPRGGDRGARERRACALVAGAMSDSRRGARGQGGWQRVWRGAALRARGVGSGAL